LEQPPSSLVRLGVALRTAGSVPAAERLLRRAQAESPADFWLNMELGYTLAEAKRPPDLAQALRFDQAALALRPQSPVVYVNLGVTLADQGKPVEAEAVFRRAIHLQPDFAVAHLNLGGVLVKKGKPAEGEAHCRKAVELMPDCAEAYATLGAALLSQPKPAEAEAAFRKALALKPDLPGAYGGLGLALLRQRKLAEAEVAYHKAIQLGPERAVDHLRLGNALHGQRKFADAEAAYRKAIELKPDFVDAHNNLGALLCDELGRPAEAETAFRKALRLKPDEATVYCNLGNALRRQKKMSEAVAAYRRAVEFKPDDMRLQPRYNAACAAALAAAGKGQDAGKLDDKERARLRKLALGWLRADLSAYRRLLEKQPDKLRTVVGERMRHWQQDAGFASVRGEALGKLPEAERKEWQTLWQEVEALRKGSTTPPKGKKPNGP
jgi:tetratricopeptide (TPR) repeat protein